MARATSAQRGYNARWQRTRRRYLRTHSACEDASGCTQPAEDVHHLDGLGPLGPRGHDPTNLQALCHKHHSQITAQRAGGWRPAGKRKREAPAHPGLRSSTGGGGGLDHRDA